MTTGTPAQRRARSAAAPAVLLSGLALVLAGCESSTSILSGNQPAAAVAEPAAKPATTSIAIAPMLGVPEASSKQVIDQLTAALDKSKFSVAAANQPADYTMRGYATVAKEKAGSKVSYFFDVVDKTGKTVNRIAGDEIAATPPAANKELPAPVVQAIAAKTAQSFAAWLPGPNGAAVAQAAPTAGGAPGAAPIKAAAGVADAAVAAQPANVKTQVAAIEAEKAGPPNAIVPSVTGAPGDGSQSLTAAIQKELSTNGVALAATTGGGKAYRVEGKVALGAEKDGKQPIRIDWVVKDPKGGKLGTVTQNNEIPKGSLDGAWGKVADAIAGAAAQGILKLINEDKAATTVQ